MRIAVLFVAALLLSVAVPAQAQTMGCGDIEIVFKNPDLQPGADGYIHAQGQFFAQFQAIGPGADDIEVFGFSFGPQTADFDETACDQPIWFTGPYVLNYRADRDASDGFFIPLVTPLVPDGEYAAAVHVYDGNDNELARFWAKAIVDNCDGGSGSRDCPDEHANNDKTAPWPMILPGDGQPMEGRALSIEFGEPIDPDTFKVFLNNEDITAAVTEWEGRVWDADYTPDYGPYGTGSTVSPPCTQPYHTCMKYGPAFEWNERPLTSDDVLRVEAADLAGNFISKDIHIGSSVAGGAITADIPIIQWSVNKNRETVAPGSTAVFQFTIDNSGAAEGHPFAGAEGPDGWALEWQPNHVPVKPGEKETQEFLVTPPASTPSGIYEVNATMEYEQAGQTKSLKQVLTINVGNVAPGGGNTTSGPTAGGEEATPEEDSPSVGLFAVVALLGAALLRRRR